MRPVAKTCMQPVNALFDWKALSEHLSYSLSSTTISKCRCPLILFVCFTGTARLPEASENPLLLKQVVRKPLEAVLRYLGI